MSITITDRASLTQMITAKMTALPQAPRRVALFVLNHPARVPFMNTTELAQAAGTSQSSVTRFVVGLGYRSYAEFISALSQVVLEEINETIPAERFARAQGAVRLADLLDAEIRHLGGLKQILRSETFLRWVVRLSEARRTLVVGLGAAASIATHVHLYLSRLQSGVSRLTDLSAPTITELVHMDERDVALVFAVPRYIKDTVPLMNLLADQGLRLLLVTDRTGTDLAPLASDLLLVPITNGPTTAVPAALLTLGSLLVEAVALHTPHRTMAHLDTFEALASAADLFVQNKPRTRPVWKAQLEPYTELG